jgi:hypothetical protein
MVESLDFSPKVNWKQMLEHLKRAYKNTDPSYIFIVENIGNSMDSKATEISIHIFPDKRAIVFGDNGEGMDNDVLSSFFSAFDSKNKGKEQIGFVGIGAKLFLDQCDNIFVLTRPKNEDLRIAKWRLKGDEPEIDAIKLPISEIKNIENKEYKDKIEKFKDLFDLIKNNLKNNIPEFLQNIKGTAIVYMNIKENTFDKLKDINEIKKYILENFRFNLLPHKLYPYGDGHLKIYIKELNSNKVFLRDEIEDMLSEKNIQLKSKIIKIDEKNLKINGEIKYILPKQNVELPPEYKDGISIIVANKIIKNTWFNLNIKELEKQWIYGYIRCDDLKEALNLAKDGFDERKKIYKKFEEIVYRQLSDTLKEWNLLVENKNKDQNINNIIEKINKIFQKNFPKIKDLINPFTTKERADVFVSGGDPSGEKQSVEETLTSDKTKGGQGHKFSEKGYIKSEKGEEKQKSDYEGGEDTITQRKRSIPGKLNITIAPLEEKIKCKLVGDIYQINENYPLYKTLENDERKLFIYMVESIIEELCRNKGEGNVDPIKSYEECKYEVLDILKESLKE